jgi:hypothetical protein
MDILKKNSKYMSVSVSVSVSMSLSLSLSVSPALVHFLAHVLVRVRVHVNIKYGAMNIYVLHGNPVVDSQRTYKVARKLKGPPTWE